MTANTLFIVILVIFIADYLFGRYIAFLNVKNSKKPIPELLGDIYDTEKYVKQQAYFRTNSRFGMLTDTFSSVLMLLMLLFGGFVWLDNVVTCLNLPEEFTAILFFGIIYFASDILSLPFEIYDTFVIEQRFSFNMITPKVFVLDKLKGYLLTILIGGGMLYLIVWIYLLTPAYFWLLAWAVTTFFSLFMSLFYSDLIVPLFNRQTPLPDGELRDAIENFANKVNFSLKNIYVIDGSKRTTKANAYFTGFWGKKRVVLYDTLIQTMTSEEIVAVLSHEIGHYKHRDTLKSMAIMLPSNLLVFVLLGLILKYDIFAQALGSEVSSFHINILSFGILYTPISMLLGIFGNILSRKHEYAADNFAKQYDFGDQLISSLKKLSATSLSNLTPHPLAVFLQYSHPTLLQRISKLNN
ncbi:MAG: M48 family metallopeptidase [Prevotellaceae bacterium]|jgi:STE24 endopeptidase|nr:M48 family metallopeptidase [Prevotellaceae bacterium]